MRRKLTIALPCLLLAMLIAGHTAAWFAGSRYLETGFNGWIAQRRAAGWQVEAGTPVRGGQPLAATLTVPDAQPLAAGSEWSAQGRVSWQGERVVLSLSMTSPDRLGIELAGAQSAQIAPGPDVPFSADRLRIEVPLARAATHPPLRPGWRSAPCTPRALTVGLLTGQVVAGD